MIESEGWKEEIQKHVFIVNLENRRDMEEEEMEGSEEDEVAVAKGLFVDSRIDFLEMELFKFGMLIKRKL